MTVISPSNTPAWFLEKGDGLNFLGWHAANKAAKKDLCHVFVLCTRNLGQCKYPIFKLLKTKGVTTLKDQSESVTVVHTNILSQNEFQQVRWFILVVWEQI